MKKELMRILVCPVCKDPLQLNVSKEDCGEVISGFLHCPSCRHSYPIENSIPNLLPPTVDKTQGE
ncbi:MAG: methytransferase partner Trm112 [Dehalococcoidia bacterium]|nr:methytransferase partner Trm112 [Dehalococcoidia bacterium]